MSVVGALVSIHCGGGLVVALVLVVINAEGVKKKKKKKKKTYLLDMLAPICGGWGVVATHARWRVGASLDSVLRGVW